MSKSKRKSISLSAPTYAKLKAYCELNGIPMAQLVELRVDEFLNSQPEDLLGEQPAVAGGQS